MARSKCLVTGGVGFIGSHIVERLLGAGHEVVCLDNFDDYYDPSLKHRNVRRFRSDPGFTMVVGDILDEGILKRSVQDSEYIFHLAARPGIRASIKEPGRAHEVNATGTLRVLEAARSAGVKKVIFASSSSVYGNSGRLPLAEDMPTRPISPYGVSKLCAENYCRVYRDIYGLETVALRYFTVYGPRMRPDLAISAFTASALAGRDIDIFGDGNKSRDFTYVDDAADAAVSAMSRGEGVYNIGGGRAVTVNELAAIVVEYTGSKSRICHHREALGDMDHTLADIGLASKALGYEPKIGIYPGLKRYIHYVRSQIEI